MASFAVKTEQKDTAGSSGSSATTTIVTTSGEESLELRLLNNCLSTAAQVHYLVSSSFSGDDWQSSTLLHEETQLYMSALLNRYSASAALRARLVSGDSLYYLQCLTDPSSRCDFIRVAASPLFPFASPE